MSGKATGDAIAVLSDHISAATKMGYAVDVAVAWREAITAYLSALAEDMPSENGLRHINTYYRDTVGSILADNCVKAADLVRALTQEEKP